MGFFKGAMLTANVVSGWISNARTKKDIQKICKEASEANFLNRGVLALPHVNRLQLRLTAKDADDDIYTYDTKSTTPGIDYLWGETDEPENTIISGGKADERVRAIMPFIKKSQQKGIPVVVLHSGNRELEGLIKSHSVACEFVSQKEMYYDAFRTLPVEDIAYLLFETMSGDSNPNAVSMIRALLEMLLRKENKVTFQNLAMFPLVKLMDELNILKLSGEVTPDEFNDISRDYMAGSSEIDAVRGFLNKLSRQADSIFGKPRTNAGNTKKILNLKGVIAIDIGIGGNDLLISFVINQLKYLQSVGKNFAIVVDSIVISKFAQICDILRGRTYAIIHNDFISSLYGGERKGEDLFAEITGDVPVVVLFSHRSGTSCQKWSEYLGKYHKIRIKKNISQTSSFFMGGNTRGISVDETDEPRVRAETISILPDSMACIHKKNGTLFAEI